MTNELAEHFAFLDVLRESGATCDRFGPAEHLMLAFDLVPTEARRVHMAWMKTFDRARTPARPRQSVDVAQNDTRKVLTLGTSLRPLEG
jgi:hypothetical protein